ncbi:LRR receptor-like serine/threonine-protein kinase [Populus alba x Populus x berolinensis]|nr:LRR receptor-like serine/threonine-protein kinase [Populus alba x Populus x berolinensis]
MALWPSLLSKTFSVLVSGFVVLNCFAVDKFGSHAQGVTPLLPLDEVQILQNISNKLNISNWAAINQTSCDSAQWKQTSIDHKTQSMVTCDCTFENGSVCHVTNIRVKRHNLNGVLPEELGDLPHLLEIDLTRNYINGTIPPRLAQLPNLKKLSLIVNRLTGPIPPEIGNITTLEELVLEDNLLGGPLPPDLGNLKSLRRLLLSGNNFTGTIPDTFGNLKNLNDLDLQGTSMEGPIPSTISLFKKLKNLRISDLKGSSPTFPDLKDMTKMEILILRNCSMTGSIPEYLGNMAYLNTLDLSFNKLTGQIPGPLGSLKNIAFMFLNNNLLTGEVPVWILLESKKDLDLSYNNFTGSVQSTQLNCRQLPVNLVASHVSTGSNKISWCLNKDLVCTRKPQYHSLFINCGGSRETGKVVEANFNIMEEAGGVGIGITKVFDGIIVNGTTLEIHLYWSGKGTTAVPDRGVYGPLISAITVTPNFKVDNGGGLSVGAIIGIVAAPCVLVALVMLVLRKKGYLGGKNLEDKEQGNLLELVDPSLGSNYSKIEALRMLDLALLCTNPSPTLRPSMSSAVKMLEGQIPVQVPKVKRSTMNQDARNKQHWRAWSFELALSAVYVTIYPNLQISFCLEALFYDPKEHLNKNLSSNTYSKVIS